MSSRLRTRSESTRDSRGRLEKALDRHVMAPLLARTLEREDGDSLACQIVDVKHRPGGRATVLYRLGETLVLGVLEPNGGPASPRAQAAAPLGMHVYEFPRDPLLPGLATAVDGEAIRPVLDRALPECREGRWELLRCRPHLVRYRPTRRATLRVDLSVRDSSSGAIETPVTFVKLYSDGDKARAVHADSSALAGSRSLRRGRVAVARPQAFVPELVAVLFEPLEGRPVEPLLASRQGTGVVMRVARALAALHTTEVASCRRRPVGPALARMRRRAGEVRTFEQALGDQMVSLVERLAGSLSEIELPSEALSLVHGDCKPSQFMVSGESVSVLDLDRCGMADPACDLGDFLAGLQSLRLRDAMRGRGHGPTVPRDLEKAFVREYRRYSSEGNGLRARISWYQAAALLRKAYRAFQRSPRSPLPDRLVSEAWECLLPAWTAKAVRS